MQQSKVAKLLREARATVKQFRPETPAVHGALRCAPRRLAVEAVHGSPTRDVPPPQWSTMSVEETLKALEQPPPRSRSLETWGDGRAALLTHTDMRVAARAATVLLRGGVHVSEAAEALVVIASNPAGPDALRRECAMDAVFNYRTQHKEDVATVARCGMAALVLLDGATHRQHLITLGVMPFIAAALVDTPTEQVVLDAGVAIRGCVAEYGPAIAKSSVIGSIFKCLAKSSGKALRELARCVSKLSFSPPCLAAMQQTTTAAVVLATTLLRCTADPQAMAHVALSLACVIEVESSAAALSPHLSDIQATLSAAIPIQSAKASDELVYGIFSLTANMSRYAQLGTAMASNGPLAQTVVESLRRWECGTPDTLRLGLMVVSNMSYFADATPEARLSPALESFVPIVVHTFQGTNVDADAALEVVRALANYSASPVGRRWLERHGFDDDVVAMIASTDVRLLYFGVGTLINLAGDGTSRIVRDADRTQRLLQHTAELLEQDVCDELRDALEQLLRNVAAAVGSS